MVPFKIRCLWAGEEPLSDARYTRAESKNAGSKRVGSKEGLVTGEASRPKTCMSLETAERPLFIYSESYNISCNDYKARRQKNCKNKVQITHNAQ